MSHNKSIITTAAIFLACASAPTTVFAEGLEGSLSVGGIYSSQKGSAKASEYKNVESSGTTDINLNYRSESEYLDLEGSFTTSSHTDHARDDISVVLKTGMTDLFKSTFYYNTIPHNITNSARTYYNGIGTDALSLNTSQLTNPSNIFDYGITRINYGAEVELKVKDPLSIIVGTENTNISGLQPYHYYKKELPVPIDQTINNYTLQSNYKSDRVVASLDLSASKFDNDRSTITITDSTAFSTYSPFKLYMPQSNESYKIGTSILYKSPFWATNYSIRASRSILTSSQTTSGELAKDSASTGYAAYAILPTVNWDGRVTYTTISASANSNPSKDLTTKLNYNYISRTNDSDRFNYYTTASTSLNTLPSNQGYKKQSAGFEVDYRLNNTNKLSAGYDYTVTNRDSFWTSPSLVIKGNPEASKTANNIIFVQIKNTSLDWMTSKLRFEHKVQNSSYGAFAAYSSNNVGYYYREAEDAHKVENSAKVDLDLELGHGFDLGLQYAMKIDGYGNSPLGMQNERHNELYMDVSYVNTKLKANVYGELEHVQSDVRFNTAAADAAYAATKNYISQTTSLNYALGSKLSYDFIKNNLNGALGLRYERANGSNDFIASPGFTTPQLTDVKYLDDYIKRTLNASMSYKINKSTNVDVGYTYENLRYNDDAYIGYQYIPGTNMAYTGAYANPNYTANIVYTKLTYKF